MDLTCSKCGKVYPYGSEFSFIWTCRDDNEEAVFGTDTFTYCKDCMIKSHELKVVPECVLCRSDVNTCYYTSNNESDVCKYCFELPFVNFLNVTHKTLCSIKCFERHKATTFDNDLSMYYRCNYCDNLSRTMPKCKGCNSARYCDRECQKKDWVKHKTMCGK